MSNSNNQLFGNVAEFDHHRGLGTVESEDIRYVFHCAEITDETRDIAIGAPVSFVPVERFGLLEASHIVKL